MIVGLKMEFSSTGYTVQFLASHDKKPSGEEGLADAANVIRHIAIYGNRQGASRTVPYKATFRRAAKCSRR